MTLDRKMLEALAASARNANITGDFTRIQESMRLLVAWNHAKTSDRNGELSDQEMRENEISAFVKLIVNLLGSK